MKKVLLLLCLVFCGCSYSSEEVKLTVMPKELEDCRMFHIENGMDHFTVMRCPNSTTTTTTQEKSPRTVIVVDGIEYIKQEKN